jgi:hypothetical protein
MEIVHVKLTAAELVEVPLPIAVPHADTGLDTELTAGQDVILSDLDGEFHGGTVLEVAGERTRPVYVVEVGARLPVDLVAERVADLDVEPERADTHLLVDLLGDLRNQWREQQRGTRRWPDDAD